MAQPLPRFTDQAVEHDPIEIMRAQRERKEAQAKAKIEAGTYLAPDPADLRGIPCIARGTGGTSPGTQPEGHLISAERRRERNAA